MKETLQISLQSQPLIEWRDDVKQDLSENMYIFSQDGILAHLEVNTFVPHAHLILMGKKFDTTQLTALLTLLTEQGVKQTQIYAPNVIEGVVTLRLALDAFPDSLKRSLELFTASASLDFALMEKFPDWTQPGIVLMDMDSTTIQIECIDEIARLYGVGEQVSAVTALAMQGKLDFNESLRTRVGKLEGMPIAILQEVADNMPLMPGLQALIVGLKSAGWKVAIASGGFNYFADKLKVDHGFDFTIANTLEIEDAKLTGQVTGEIVNAEVKARTLVELASTFNIPMSQTVAIGDGANDLVMMAQSAMGIAIHAKPIVQAQAAISLNNIDLQGALAILSANNNANWQA